MKNKSIIMDRLDRCLICKSYQNIEIHHCIHGIANRKLSDKYNLVVSLCYMHHRGTNGCHGKNGAKLDLELKKIAQKSFEFHHGTREDFIRIFGKSYL
jgi:hypothetical protein